MSWVWIVLLGMLALEQFVDRKRLARVRGARLSWKETARTLSRDQQREVGRAVWNGRAVADPDLADPAVEMAAMVAAGRARHPLGWVHSVLFVAWQVAIAVMVGLQRTWPLALLIALAPLFFIFLFALGFQRGRRAEGALVANRRLLDQRPRRQPTYPPPSPPERRM